MTVGPLVLDLVHHEGRMDGRRPRPHRPGVRLPGLPGPPRRQGLYPPHDPRARLGTRATAPRTTTSASTPTASAASWVTPTVAFLRTLPGVGYELVDDDVPDRAAAAPRVHRVSAPRGRGSLVRRAVVATATAGGNAGGSTMHDLVIRGGTVVDGTGSEARTADVAVDDGRIVAVDDLRGRAGTPDHRRRRPAGHAGVGGHPHPLRRTGDVGRGPGPEQLARGHHPGDRQLRRRLRPGPSRPARLAHRTDGGGGGHPRHGAVRGHQLGLGELPPVPRRPRPPASGPSMSEPRSPTAPSGPTSWATGAPTTSRPRPRTSSR